MSASSINVAATVFAYCGLSACFLLFLSPVPTCKRVAKMKSTMEFSPVPYLAQFVESFYWSIWAFTAGDLFEVMLCNSIGASFNMIYAVVFLVYAAEGKRCQMWSQFAFALALIACAAPVLAFVPNPDKVFGWTALILCFIKCASPLTVARLVIETKSVEYMPLPLTVTLQAATVFWTLHGLLKNEPFVWIPNLVGLVLTLIQLTLYIRYGCCGRSDSEVTIQEEQSEVEKMEEPAMMNVTQPDKIAATVDVDLEAQRDDVHMEGIIDMAVSKLATDAETSRSSPSTPSTLATEEDWNNAAAAEVSERPHANAVGRNEDSL